MKTYHDPTTGEANQEAYALVCEHDPLCGLNVHGRADEVARIDRERSKALDRLAVMKLGVYSTQTFNEDGERYRICTPNLWHVNFCPRSYYAQDVELMRKECDRRETLRAEIDSIKEPCVFGVPKEPGFGSDDDALDAAVLALRTAGLMPEAK